MPFLRAESQVLMDSMRTWWKAHTSELHKAGLSWEAISKGCS